MKLSATVFESPWTLVPAFVALEMVLLAVWQRRRTPWTGRAAAAGLAAIPLSVAAQALVVTDAEHIERLCRDVASAVARGDLAALRGQLSDQFAAAGTGEELGKSELLDRARRALQRWSVEEQRLSDFHTEVHADRATVTFQVSCRLTTDDRVVPRHVSRWRLTAHSTGGVWKVTGLRPVRSRLLPYDSLGHLLR